MTQATLGKSILIVEDEADMADILRFNLEKEGYRCRRVGDGSTAWAEIRKQAPDLVILDRMLPGGSGDEVATKMRGDPRTNYIPVLMLTAKAEETDQLVGFALGASDYVTKPFNMKVLAARVGSLLRRPTQAQESEFITGGPITLDQSRFEVCVDGDAVALTTTEFRILKTLMAAEGRVLDRSRLIDLVLGPTVAVTDRTIDVHIAGLRKKLGSAKDWVQTVRGVGYTFRSP